MYQFKVQLIDVDSPKVWRQIIVPEQYSFLSLHYAIKAAFGWKNGMSFRFEPEDSADPVILGYDQHNDENSLDAAETLLSDIFVREQQIYIYTYIPGVKWLHHLQLEKILDCDLRKPDCIAGEGCCPPEYCMGTDDYQKTKEIMADNNHPEYIDTKNWMELNEQWNPCEFDLAETKERIANVNGGPSFFRNYHIASHDIFDEKYGLTPELWELIDEVNEQITSGTGDLGKLKNLTEKYPNMPHFRNMLSVYYLREEKKFRRFRKIARQIIKEFPEYVLARCNMASYYTLLGQLTKVPEYLGNELDLSILYPERNSSFTEVEIFNYHATAFQYLIAKEDVIEAQKHFIFLGHFYPEATKRGELFLKMISLRYKKNSEKLKKEHTVKAIAQYVPPTEEAPMFRHREVEIFYRKSWNINRDTLRKIIALPQETLVEDMKKMLMDSISRHTHFLSREKLTENDYSFHIHAFHILSSLKAEEAFDTVLTVMRQDKEYFDFWFGYILTEDFWRFLYMIAQNRLDRLKDFMLEPNRHAFVRTAVSETVLQVAMHQPDRKWEALQWYYDVLRAIIEKKDDLRIFDTIVFSSVVHDLMIAGDRQQFPLIEECFATGLVSEIYVGALQDVKNQLVNEDKSYYKNEIFATIDQYYDNWKIKFGMRQSDEPPSTKLAKPVKPIKPATQSGNTHKAARNAPCPCGSGKKYKRCCSR